MGNDIKKPKYSVENFKCDFLIEVQEYLDNISDEELANAADLIIKCVENGCRVHVSGIGKPSHVAQYIAALMSSTGTPSYFLDGTEAVHGSCGQTRPGDVVIVISNSGETSEMKSLVSALINNHCEIIGVSGKKQSWLALHSDAFIYAAVNKECGPLNRAPRLSVIAETIALQALSVILQNYNKVTPEQYIRWHPGGALGKLRDGEEEN